MKIKKRRKTEMGDYESMQERIGIQKNSKESWVKNFSRISNHHFKTLDLDYFKNMS